MIRYISDDAKRRQVKERMDACARKLIEQEGNVQEQLRMLQLSDYDKDALIIDGEAIMSDLATHLTKKINQAQWAAFRRDPQTVGPLGSGDTYALHTTWRDLKANVLAKHAQVPKWALQFDRLDKQYLLSEFQEIRYDYIMNHKYRPAYTPCRC